MEKRDGGSIAICLSDVLSHWTLLNRPYSETQLSLCPVFKFFKKILLEEIRQRLIVALL